MLDLHPSRKRRREERTTLPKAQLKLLVKAIFRHELRKMSGKLGPYERDIVWVTCVHNKRKMSGTSRQELANMTYKSHVFIVSSTCMTPLFHRTFAFSLTATLENVSRLQCTSESS